MSLDLVRKNSGSPFRLQRSMVDQGGEGGAYEAGGFNPDMVYNNEAANAAVESFGKIVGAALGSRTAEDANNANKAKLARLEKRGKRLVEKSNNSSGNKMERIEKRIGNIGTKIQNTSSKIKKYEESVNPTIKSSLLTDLAKESAKNKVASEKKAKEEKETKETLGSLKKSLGNIWRKY